MKKNLKRQSIIHILALVLSCAFLGDMCICCKIFRPIMVVSDGFITSVFSGILTFSTLSLTVLSMVIGMMDTKMSGLKLREMLALDASPIKFSTYLWYSTCLSLLSIVALAFNLCTLMTSIAVCTLLYTTYISVNVFRLVSDTQMCLEIILEEYKSRGIQFISNFVYRWLDEYECALQSNRLSELNQYSELLQKCTTDKSSAALIQRRLTNLLNVACLNMSFAEAISWVFDKTGFSMHAESVCENYIRSIQFFGADELIHFDIPGKIQSLINDGAVLHNLRSINISYFLISKLIDNETAGSTKLEILDSCLGLITNFPFIQEIKPTDSSVQGIDRIKQEMINISLLNASQINKGIILRVFLEKVLLSSNSLGDVVYEKLITYLYLPGISRRNSAWIETVACMYEYCYLLVYKSNQIVQEEKERIVSLVTRHSYSLWDMVRNKITDILSYYVVSGFNMDYISDAIFAGAVSAVDSVNFCESNNIRFAYTLYLATPVGYLSRDFKNLPLKEKSSSFNCHKVRTFPLLQRLDKMDYNLQRACSAILKMFDPNTGMLTEECIKDITNLQKMNGEGFLSIEAVVRFKEQAIDSVFQSVCEALQDANIKND